MVTKHGSSREVKYGLGRRRCARKSPGGGSGPSGASVRPIALMSTRVWGTTRKGLALSGRTPATARSPRSAAREGYKAAGGTRLAIGCSAQASVSLLRHLGDQSKRLEFTRRRNGRPHGLGRHAEDGKEDRVGANQSRPSGLEACRTTKGERAKGARRDIKAKRETRTKNKGWRGRRGRPKKSLWQSAGWARNIHR